MTTKALLTFSARINDTNSMLSKVAVRAAPEKCCDDQCQGAKRPNRTVSQISPLSKYSGPSLASRDRNVAACFPLLFFADTDRKTATSSHDASWSCRCRCTRRVLRNPERLSTRDVSSAGKVKVPICDAKPSYTWCKVCRVPDSELVSELFHQRETLRTCQY